MSNADTRPRLIDLWVRHRFRTDVLAEASDVPEEVILRMFRYEDVNRETAEKVLAALSRLCSREYTLETVRIDLDHEEARNRK